MWAPILVTRVGVIVLHDMRMANQGNPATGGATGRRLSTLFSIEAKPIIGADEAVPGMARDPLHVHRPAILAQAFQLERHGLLNKAEVLEEIRRLQANTPKAR